MRLPLRLSRLFLATWVAAVGSGDALAQSRQVWMLVVTGLGGEPEYASAFAEQGDSAASHAEAAGARVTLLTGDAARREAIQGAIAAVAEAAGENDAVIVHLIGHGTFDGEHYRYNVPGPDPTAEDFATWLRGVPAKRQLAVIATSASGAAQEALRHDGRSVITATRHGRERNATVFGMFWAAALAAPGADIDKDERLSADEAFRFAEHAVAGYYEDQQRIATEHPRLEGDASLFVVARTAPEQPVDPGLVHLVDRVGELTDAIDALKTDRRVLTDEAYFTRLHELLMELARVDHELKARTQEVLDPVDEADTSVPFRDLGP